jgi:hypothetical protein
MATDRDTIPSPPPQEDDGHALIDFTASATVDTRTDVAELGPWSIDIGSRE